MHFSYTTSHEILQLFENKNKNKNNKKPQQKQNKKQTP